MTHSDWNEAVEMAAQAIERKAVELDRKECCGNGRSNHPEEPPECCGDPDFMISNVEAAAEIRALKRPAEPRQEGMVPPSVIFRIRFEQAGGHVHMRLFSGPHEGALGKCGDLCMRVEEFYQFRDIATFVQFVTAAPQSPAPNHAGENAKDKSR